MPARTKAKVSRETAVGSGHLHEKKSREKREEKEKKSLSRRRPRADQNRHHSVGGSPRGRIGSLFIISACVRRPEGGPSSVSRLDRAVCQQPPETNDVLGKGRRRTSAGLSPAQERKFPTLPQHSSSFSARSPSKIVARAGRSFPRQGSARTMTR